MNNGNGYGICSYCGAELEAVWFREEEYRTDYQGRPVKTGRVRRAVDYLVCPVCMQTECVDDSFDGSWHYE